MAISVDRVYQKVLAIANKEQRGYITPQEFNLFADQAQIEIFEQYFYDLNQFKRVVDNDTVYANPTEIIEEKISIFRHFNVGQTITNEFGLIGQVVLPGFDIHRIESVRVQFGNMPVKEASQIDMKEEPLINQSPLLKPTKTYPKYMRLQDSANSASRLIIYPYPTDQDSVLLNLIRRPRRPNWTYVVSSSSSTALYNAGAPDAQDFELHPSDESELVHRILILAGIMMQKADITQSAAGLETAKIQQEKI